MHEVNKDLSTEIKKYNDKVLYLTKVISTYKKKIILDSNKTTVLTSPIIDTTVIYSDSVAKIGCKVRVFELEKELKVICSIEYYELEMPIYLGIMENNQGVVSTFARSDIDKINFNIFSTMKPAMFTNVEQSRYGIGFYAGGGLQSNFTSEVKLGLSVGLCFYY